jgi:hypothetical protein
MSIENLYIFRISYCKGDDWRSRKHGLNDLISAYVVQRLQIQDSCVEQIVPLVS